MSSKTTDYSGKDTKHLYYQGCKLAQSPLSLTYDKYILSGGVSKRMG